MCPKPFLWAKNKRKLFCDGKSRGPLLAGAALKFTQLEMKEDNAFPFFFFFHRISDLQFY